MSPVLELLTAASTIGAFDVLYFHLYRFRLYRQPDSVAEELTHLARHVLFVAIAAIVVFGDGSAGSKLAVWALFGLDLVNSSADVVLERRSRAALGGLPSAEALLHMLATFLVGATAATYYWHGDAPLTSFQSLRGGALVVAGIATFALEGVLFARALGARAGRAALPARPAPT